MHVQTTQTMLLAVINSVAARVRSASRRYVQGCPRAAASAASAATCSMVVSTSPLGGRSVGCRAMQRCMIAASAAGQCGPTSTLKPAA